MLANARRGIWHFLALSRLYEAGIRSLVKLKVGRLCFFLPVPCRNAMRDLALQATSEASWIFQLWLYFSQLGSMRP